MAQAEGLDKTPQDFFQQFDKEMHQRPGLRLGQSAYNALFAIHPDLARSVIARDMDPFYDDNRLPAFLAYVDANWNVEELD